jgi:hypothetical protein
MEMRAMIQSYCGKATMMTTPALDAWILQEQREMERKG